ncbi:hypothetical protein PPERSA_12450 [Pseudocohnilembus persalinus]|uniref:Calycin-like protein n=1 Tax=Pseudocohnilembus persalinus TaxID=266149 RepID=A0A0V0QNR4_PSEPJ|nr:hypothetical protein PPERSA_12450 [Pseudocohnilembus persalinus]|eukprot:KRX04003.1 hypothetical protein PPERSA_12450 [Pseudocohnilembus persalinus]
MFKNNFLLGQLLIILTTFLLTQSIFHKHTKNQEEVMQSEQNMVGGWQTVDFKSDENKQIIDEAVNYLNENIHECPDNTFWDWQLKTLDKAQFQVVAGLQVRLDGKFVKKNDGGEEQEGDVLIWMHPMDSKTHEAPIEIEDCQWINQ